MSQFDSKFTRQTPVDSPDDSTLSESANQVFLGFTYVAPSVLESVKEKFSLNQKSGHLEDLLEAHEHLSAQSNFLLGISGEEVLQPARQILRLLWNTQWKQVE